jgi:hypothetical protein
MNPTPICFDVNLDRHKISFSIAALLDDYAPISLSGFRLTNSMTACNRPPRTHCLQLMDWPGWILERRQTEPGLHWSGPDFVPPSDHAALAFENDMRTLSARLVFLWSWSLVGENAPFGILKSAISARSIRLRLPKLKIPLASPNSCFDLVSVCVIKIDWRGLALAWLGFDVPELPLRPTKLRFRFRLVV